MKSFPQTVSDAFILLNNWKNNPRNVQRHNVSEGVAFATKNEKSNYKGNKKKTKTISHAINAMKSAITQMNVRKIMSRAISS